MQKNVFLFFRSVEVSLSHVELLASATVHVGETNSVAASTVQYWFGIPDSGFSSFSCFLQSWEWGRREQKQSYRKFVCLHDYLAYKSFGLCACTILFCMWASWVAWLWGYWQTAALFVLLGILFFLGVSQSVSRLVVHDRTWAIAYLDGIAYLDLLLHCELKCPRGSCKGVLHSSFCRVVWIATLCKFLSSSGKLKIHLLVCRIWHVFRGRHPKTKGYLKMEISKWIVG